MIFADREAQEQHLIEIAASARRDERSPHRVDALAERVVRADIRGPVAVPRCRHRHCGFINQELRGHPADFLFRDGLRRQERDSCARA
jgi:hypothetical protein